MLFGFNKRKKTKVESSVPKKDNKMGKKPRPWKASDRLILLAIFLIFTISPAFLALASRAYKLPGLPRLAIPELSFKKTYEFHKDPQKANLKPIIDSFTQKTDNLSGIYSFYVYSLADAREYGVLESQKMQAASLIKLPVLLTLYQKAEEGIINLEDKYTLNAEDKIAGAGSLYSEKVGSVYSYRELAELMGQQSDNTAFNVIKNLVGSDAVNALIKDLKMDKTSLEDNTTSAKDTADLYLALWNGGLLSRSHRDEILGYLTNTLYEQVLPANLPEDVIVAHKYGREVHVINDAGIVFADNLYIIILMSEGIVDEEAEEFLPTFSKQVYDFEVNN